MLLLAYAQLVRVPYLLAQDLLDAGNRLVDGWTWSQVREVLMGRPAKGHVVLGAR
jgi:hypothetical protein